MSSENQFSSVVPGDLSTFCQSADSINIKKLPRMPPNTVKQYRSDTFSTLFMAFYTRVKLCGSVCDDSRSPRSLTPR